MKSRMATVTKYMMLMSSNWNRKPKDDIINLVSDELDGYSIDAIENGLNRLLREETHYPSIATILQYVGREQGRMNAIQPKIQLEEFTPSDNDKHITHLFLQVLAENMKSNKGMDYNDLLTEISDRATADGLPTGYIDSKINKLYGIFRRDEINNGKYCI